MPRIRQLEWTYRTQDFLKAFRKGQAEADLMHLNEVTEAAEIPYSTLWKRMQEPDKLTVAELRKLIHVVPITPLAVLAFLGCQTNDIKKESE